MLPLGAFAQEYTLIDFGSATNSTTVANWNNVASTSDNQEGIIVNLTNTTGAATGAVLTIDDSFHGVNENGTTSPDTNLPFVGSSTRDSFYGEIAPFNGVTNPTGGFTLSGLNPAKYYTFKIFASRNGVSDNRETLYTVMGLTTATSTLNTSNNISNTADVLNIKPNANGAITFQATKGPNNTNATGFYYLGAIQLITTDAPFSEPVNTSLALLYPNGGEIWHATSKPFITWEAQGLSGNATIQYSVNNGTNWITLATVSAALGSYEWTIPYNISSECKVKITVDGMSDESENTFSIIENTLKRFKIVVLGSSTAAGTGPSTPANGWVALYTKYLKQIDTRFDVTNLAVGGYTTYDVLPTGTPIPAGVNETIDLARNITKAISLNADGIIVNMPSNDSNMGYSVAAQMANFNLLNTTATNASIPISFCTIQPRDFGSNSNGQSIHTQMITQIPTVFPTNYIDFWTGFANAAGTDILDAFDSGDGIHMNDAGHKILLQRVIATGFQNVVKIGDDGDDNAVLNEKNFLVDFNLNTTTMPTTGNWNNINSAAVSTPVAIIDDLGIASTIQIAVTDNFLQANDLGATQPSGTTIYPASAIRDAVYGDNTNPTGVITFSGLDPQKLYSFDIIASRKDVTDNRETLYTATGSTTASVTLNPSSNSSLSANVMDVMADANGTINLTVNKGVGNTNSSGFYYLNALKLNEKNVSVPDVLLNCEDGTTNKLAVLNVFANGPGQSNADMVVVDNPNPSGINTSSKVVKFTRRTSGSDAASYAGFYSNVVDPDPDFTENKYIHVKVLKQNSSGVRFKIEGGVAGTVEKLSTNVYNQVGEWVDMVFDFSEKTGVYATLGLQPDYESPLIASGDRTIYFDDIVLNNIPTPTTLSIDKVIVENGISVYPNPVSNVLNVKSKSIVKSVNIYAMDGRLLLSKNNIKDMSFEVDVTDLPSGIFIMQVLDENNSTSTRKVLKK
jgi:lysophospholipase L1-like esterase